MEQKTDTLVVNHNAGFFSCYTIRLLNILEYFNKYKKCPKNVDSSRQFLDYKTNKNTDYTSEYIRVNDHLIQYTNEIKLTDDNREEQFSDYKKINFHSVKPFIRKWFSPSEQILQLTQYLERRYKLDYENLAVFYYRGTDKHIETNLCNYDIYLDKAKQVRYNNPNVKFLIVSDEIQLINLFKGIFMDTIVFDELLQNMERSFLHSQLMLATVLIMSKAKHIICTSGNVSLWIILFRGHNINIHQFLSPREYIHGVKNTTFDSKNTTFWI
jgi:hypothetical protein